MAASMSQRTCEVNLVVENSSLILTFVGQLVSQLTFGVPKKGMQLAVVKAISLKTLAKIEKSLIFFIRVNVKNHEN